MNIQRAETQMKWKRPLSACALIVSLLAAGCTTEAWYEGIQTAAEAECRKQPDTSTEQCLSRLNRKSHRDYEKERSGQ